MSSRITVLCDNTIMGSMGAVAEHGWAVWVETAAGNYLFDTGYRSLLANASHFGVDVKSASAILISHHHVDHTGGLLDAVREMATEHRPTGVDVYAHSDLFKESYSAEPNKKREYIGIPHSRAALEGTGAVFHLSRDWQQIADGIHLTGQVPRNTDFETGDPSLKHRNAQGELESDPIMDDQSLVIETTEGLFVVLGCSHAGLVNTLDYIQRRTGQARFNTIVGGTHLGYCTEEQLQRTIDALYAFDFEILSASHCTGNLAAAQLARSFGNRFSYCGVGKKFSF